MIRNPLVGRFTTSILALALCMGRCVVAQETPAGEYGHHSSKVGELPASFGLPADLPRPSAMSVNEFEAQLFEFVNSRRYAKLGWMLDKRVRDTGPFIRGKEYGTHPAVRVFYSPEIVQWLVDGKRGSIPDGAVIVKEQFEAPAARHEGKTEEQLWDALRSWTIMVKDSQGSHDGWFWSNPGKNQKVVDYYQYPFEEPYSGFGIYCVRCHGATTSPGPTQEFTFASLRNIGGFSGEPLLFRVDDSWRVPEDHSNEALLAAVAQADPNQDSTLTEDSEPTRDSGSPPEEVVARDSHPRCLPSDFPQPCVPRRNELFIKTFGQIAPCDRAVVAKLPGVTHDSVYALPGKKGPSGEAGKQGFLTSNQCMSCHAGLAEPFGPTMFYPTGESAGYAEPGVHYSPYGEWRWTPMGLAGRDPVFHAQLESELALLKKKYNADKASRISVSLQETCLGCHGVMGKRQHDMDFANAPEKHFGIDMLSKHQLDPTEADFQVGQYAALARDGVSCVVCHRMQPRPQPEDDTRPYLEHFLETSITGNFYLGPPGDIYGPYKDDQLSPHVMEHSTGWKPKHSDYIRQSQMCGTCHTVNLPIVDWERTEDEEFNDLMLAEPNPDLRDFHHHVEQATYLEWLNSEYETEINPDTATAKSCQDCHMSKGLHDVDGGIVVDKIRTRIAAIQDTTYPDAENLIGHEQLNVRVRDEYSRHNFRGLNGFMLEMFNQFDDVLGVRKHDYMTGSKTDIAYAMQDFVRQARQETADMSLVSSFGGDGQLEVKVEIENKAGHRFPSGVGFRRAFIELLVIEEGEAGERVVWSSGRTNSIGVIVDGRNEPLVTEFFEPTENGQQAYQPHWETITRQDQVQIYETLLHSLDGEFTTSFIHGCTIIKDNRFLPRGWTAAGPGGGLKGHFLSATHPGPIASRDVRYQNGSGSDVTRYQIALPENVDREKTSVRATLYYQATPPYFLKNIFDLAPDGEAAQRLHYICSNMDLDGTPLEDWKLEIVSQSVRPSE